MIAPWPTYCSTTCSKPPSLCEVPRHGSQPSSCVERHRRSSCAGAPMQVPACSLRDTVSPVSMEEITVLWSRQISASPTIETPCGPFAPPSRKAQPSSFSPGSAVTTPRRVDGPARYHTPRSPRYIRFASPMHVPRVHICLRSPAMIESPVVKNLVAGCSFSPGHMIDNEHGVVADLLPGERPVSATGT